MDLNPAKIVANAAKPLEDAALLDLDKNVDALIAALDRFTAAVESLPAQFAEVLKRKITIE